VGVVPFSAKQGGRKMKRVIEIAVAATVVAALGIIIAWMTIGGGPTNIALGAVANALDSLRSATFDMTSETKGKDGRPSVSVTGRGFFLAPARQRMELSNPPKNTMSMVMIVDSQAGKSIMLMPDEKSAMVLDKTQISENMNKSGQAAPPDLFERVRRIVRKGASGTGEKAEWLGQKQIDGRVVAGFRTHDMAGDMTLWADPETARPVRIEIASEILADVTLVMANFHYDVALDPSLFSLELPLGYSSQTLESSTPVEEDLVRTLQTVAEHRHGMFPAKLGMNKEVMEALAEVMKPEMDRMIAKHGGLEKLTGNHGRDAFHMGMAEGMKTIMPLAQKQTQGIMFYMTLVPDNDAHYAGGGVKLGTPNRPIFWYRPTGAQKYRIICADLNVREMSAEEVKKLTETASSGKR
jgi:outer membrane lipoprotein-sorting protein